MHASVDLLHHLKDGGVKGAAILWTESCRCSSRAWRKESGEVTSCRLSDCMGGGGRSKQSQRVPGMTSNRLVFECVEEVLDEACSSLEMLRSG